MQTVCFITLTVEDKKRELFQGKKTDFTASILKIKRFIASPGFLFNGKKGIESVHLVILRSFSLHIIVPTGLRCKEIHWVFPPLIAQSKYEWHRKGVVVFSKIPEVLPEVHLLFF